MQKKLCVLVDANMYAVPYNNKPIYRNRSNNNGKPCARYRKTRGTEVTDLDLCTYVHVTTPYRTATVEVQTPCLNVECHTTLSNINCNLEFQFKTLYYLKKLDASRHTNDRLLDVLTSLCLMIMPYSSINWGISISHKSVWFLPNSVQIPSMVTKVTIIRQTPKETPKEITIFKSHNSQLWIGVWESQLPSDVTVLGFHLGFPTCHNSQLTTMVTKCVS